MELDGRGPGDYQEQCCCSDERNDDDATDRDEEDNAAATGRAKANKGPGTGSIGGVTSGSCDEEDVPLHGVDSWKPTSPGSSPMPWYDPQNPSIASASEVALRWELQRTADSRSSNSIHLGADSSR